MAAALVAEIPEVADATRIYQIYESVIRNGEIIFTEEKVFVVDSNFFNSLDINSKQET